jgi:SAM-dependent methyltransferase
MTIEPQGVVRCQVCKKELNVEYVSKDGKILRCGCYEYPQIFGITYLIKDDIARKANVLIRNGKDTKALGVLLGVGLRSFLTLLFIRGVRSSGFLSYELAVRILGSSFENNHWISYLIKRKDCSYFQVSQLLFSSVGKGHTMVLDIGCGDGQIFKSIPVKGRKKFLFGVDRVFLNLFLARIFFAKNPVLLICCDVENGLPFADARFDVVHTNDTLHYIENKSFVLEEVSRVIKKSGVLVAIHNNKILIGKDIFGISVSSFQEILKSVGFNFNHFYSDELLRFKLIVNDSILNTQENLDLKNKKEVYSVFAAKIKKSNFFIGEKRRKKYYFISPHLDDAILSCGNLIERLKRSESEVNIVTVFTRGSEAPYSQQALSYLRNSGFSSASQLFNARKIEDRKASQYLGVRRRHLNFTDAVFRKGINGKFTYDSKSQFSGTASEDDSDLSLKIASQVRQTVTQAEVVLLAPLGIGGHVDHVIVRNIVEKLPGTKVFWEDFPYNAYKENVNNFWRGCNLFKKIAEFDSQNSLNKQRAVKMYKSQLKGLFPRGTILQISEKYYIRH